MLHPCGADTMFPVQARSQAIEARLASTAAELHSLKVRQRQLENRNLLLEKSPNAASKQSQLDGVSFCTAHFICPLGAEHVWLMHHACVI